MRRHNISDWNIWYGSLGKTDYARQMGNFIAFRILIDLFFILPLRIMFALFLFGLTFVGFSIQSSNERRERIKNEQKKLDNRVSEITKQISTLVPDIASPESKSRRKTNARKVQRLIDELEALGQQHVLQDAETFKKQIGIIIRAVDVLDNLDKADKQLFLKDKKKELKYLLEALYHLKRNRITSQEFNSLQAKSEITEEFWTADYLMERMIAAGYQA